jgi:hypothetical protein
MHGAFSFVGVSAFQYQRFKHRTKIGSKIGSKMESKKECVVEASGYGGPGEL